MKAYVITSYYNNGESYDCEYYKEIPQKIYFDLKEALATDNFIKNEDEDEDYLFKTKNRKYKFSYTDMFGADIFEYWEHRIYECEVQE